MIIIYRFADGGSGRSVSLSRLRSSFRLLRIFTVSVQTMSLCVCMHARVCAFNALAGPPNELRVSFSFAPHCVYCSLAPSLFHSLSLSHTLSLSLSISVPFFFFFFFLFWYMWPKRWAFDGGSSFRSINVRIEHALSVAFEPENGRCF